MNTALWIAAAVLAVVYAGAGIFKLVTPYEKLLQNPNFGWAGDFSPTVVKGIGAVELLGAVGVVVPQLTGIEPVLTPAAAAGLALVQAGAIGVHIRRGEWKMLPVNLILLALAVFVAYGRYA